MTQVSEEANDQRKDQRSGLRAPLTVIVGDREIPARSRDLSTQGVYFYLSIEDSAMIDRDFNCLVDIPSEITRSRSCRIRCLCRLVRKETNSGNSAEVGIAAEILTYSILQEAVWCQLLFPVTGNL